MSTNPWVWFAALLTLAIFSFLYRENPFYRVAEHLVVGVANGYAITTYWYLILKPALIDLIARGQINTEFVLSILGALIGVLYFARFVPSLSWLVRIPIAVTLGYGSGYYIPRGIDAGLLRQIGGTVVTPSDVSQFPALMSTAWQQLLHVRPDLALLSFLNAIGQPTIMIGAICTVAYFYFSTERKGILKPMSSAGIIFIMLGFGASFGYTVMARISLLIGRLTFLFRDWLGLIH
ncbi:MAG: hypothetical protein ABIK62_01530 [candidate division WOR-3 bacterium]